jgi:hypothetical protein
MADKKIFFATNALLPSWLTGNSTHLKHSVTQVSESRYSAGLGSGRHRREVH